MHVISHRRSVLYAPDTCKHVTDGLTLGPLWRVCGACVMLCPRASPGLVSSHARGTLSLCCVVVSQPRCKAQILLKFT